MGQWADGGPLGHWATRLNIVQTPGFVMDTLRSLFSVETLFSAFSVQTTTRYGQPHIPHALRGRSADEVGVTRLPDSDSNVGWDVVRVLSIVKAWSLASIFCNVLVSSHGYRGEVLEDAVYFRSRSPETGLITVMAHTSEFDPGNITILMSPKIVAFPRLLRYTVAAEDQLFTTLPSSYYFQSLKVLPVTRGGGVDQDNLLRVIDKLDQGGWVELFPEGRISMTPGVPLLPIRPGVGRLIAEAKVPPMVIPIYSEGMEKAKPPDLAPNIGKDIHVHVMVGDPIDLSSVLDECAVESVGKHECWRMLADAIYDAMLELRGQLRKRKADDGF